MSKKFKRVWDPVKHKYVKVEVTKKRSGKFLSRTSLVNRFGIWIKKTDGPYRRPRVEDYSFDSMTVLELKALAKERELKNYSKLKKEKLIEIIKKSFKK